MKTIIVSLIILFSATGIHAQQLRPEQVPGPVKDRLNHTFPQAVDLPVTWEKEKANYKATLTIMDSPAIMILDSLGNPKRIERRINPVYLPDNAKAHLKKLDPDHQVISVLKVVDDKNKTTYKTVARVKTDFTFDDAGKVVGPK